MFVVTAYPGQETYAALRFLSPGLKRGSPIGLCNALSRHLRGIDSEAHADYALAGAAKPPGRRHVFPFRHPRRLAADARAHFACDGAAKLPLAA